MAYKCRSLWCFCLSSIQLSLFFHILRRIRLQIASDNLSVLCDKAVLTYSLVKYWTMSLDLVNRMLHTVY
jgi:hypothetical protein